MCELYGFSKLIVEVVSTQPNCLVELQTLSKLCTLFSYACGVHLLSLVQWFTDIVDDNNQSLYTRRFSTHTVPNN